MELLSGAIFSMGLAASGMTKASKVAGFLSFLHPAWDFSLAFVMGGALLISMPITLLLLNKKVSPAFRDLMEVPANRTIDAKVGPARRMGHTAAHATPMRDSRATLGIHGLRLAHGCSVPLVCSSSLGAPSSVLAGASVACALDLGLSTSLLIPAPSRAHTLAPWRSA